MNDSTRDSGSQSISVDQPGIYRIRVRGRLSQPIIDQFDEMSVSMEMGHADIPLTTFTGEVADQSALHGYIARIRDLGLPLVLVELVGTADQGD